MSPPTITNHQPTDSSPGDGVLIALTRMEAKVDVALAQHGAALEKVTADSSDHESRIRVLEAKPSVSPRALWLAVTSAAGVVLTIITIAEKLTGTL